MLDICQSYNEGLNITGCNSASVPVVGHLIKKGKLKFSATFVQASKHFLLSIDEHL